MRRDQELSGDSENFFYWLYGKGSGYASGDGSTSYHHPDQIAACKRHERGHGGTDCGEQSDHAPGIDPPRSELRAFSLPGIAKGDSLAQTRDCLPSKCRQGQTLTSALPSQRTDAMHRE